MDGGKGLRVGRLVLLACCVLLASGVSGPARAASPSPIGEWLRADGGTKIDISRCGQDYCAVNIWVRNPNGPEKLGDKLVMTLTPAGGDVLRGRAYDVRRQRHYAMTLTLAGTRMTTKGCVMLGIICKSMQWNRVD